ncbi:hypothetical protein FQA39_LY14339 [Lamprigera yunnana]|nr:hypothetical protein FQA39_LY14339 [Lamprigera yunnana]
MISNITANTTDEEAEYSNARDETISSGSEGKLEHPRPKRKRQSKAKVLLDKLTEIEDLVINFGLGTSKLNKADSKILLTKIQEMRKETTDVCLKIASLEGRIVGQAEAIRTLLQREHTPRTAQKESTPKQTTYADQAAKKTANSQTSSTKELTNLTISKCLNPQDYYRIKAQPGQRTRKEEEEEKNVMEAKSVLHDEITNTSKSIDLTDILHLIKVKGLVNNTTVHKTKSYGFGLRDNENKNDTIRELKLTIADLLIAMDDKRKQGTKLPTQTEPSKEPTSSNKKSAKSQPAPKAAPPKRRFSLSRLSTPSPPSFIDMDTDKASTTPKSGSGTTSTSLKQKRQKVPPSQEQSADILKDKIPPIVLNNQQDYGVAMDLLKETNITVDKTKTTKDRVFINTKRADDYRVATRLLEKHRREFPLKHYLGASHLHGRRKTC